MSQFQDFILAKKHVLNQIYARGVSRFISIIPARQITKEGGDTGVFLKRFYFDPVA